MDACARGRLLGAHEMTEEQEESPTGEEDRSAVLQNICDMIDYWLRLYCEVGEDTCKRGKKECTAQLQLFQPVYRKGMKWLKTLSFNGDFFIF